MKSWFMVALLACALVPGTSWAEELLDESIGVLEVATEGVSETAGEKLEESIEETLADVGYRVVRSSTVREKLSSGDYIAGCTFGPCMTEVRRATGLSKVLVARIQGAGQSYSVVVSLVDTDTGHLQSQVAQSCPVCTVDEAISTAALAVVELVTASPDKQDELAQPVSDQPTRDDSSSRVRKAGWVMLVSGVVAGAAGTYLLTTDEDRAGGLTAGAGAGLGLAGLVTVLLAR